MPLKGIKVSDSVKRITFKDYLPFKYEITDADIKYPVAVFKNFCKYVNSKYKAGVWGDQFLNKGDSSIVTLVYYVPIKFTKEEIESDVRAFENQYEDLKIEIKINTPQQEFNTYTDFKKGLLNQPWNLELAKKLFRLNWHSEPNLDDPDDQEELLILFNMNQESYHEYYVVDATMYFNIPDFAKNRIGEKNIDLHVYHVGDSKMKKDSTYKWTYEELKPVIFGLLPWLKEGKIGSAFGVRDSLYAYTRIKLPNGNIYGFESDYGEDYGETSIEKEIKLLMDEFNKYNSLEEIKTESMWGLDNKNNLNWFEEENAEGVLEDLSDAYLETKEDEDLDNNFLQIGNDLIKLLPKFKELINQNNLTGDSKQKDSDPRLELVEELKEYGLTDEYSLDDEFLCDDDYGIYSINKKEFLDLLNEQKDSLSLSDKFSNLSIEDLEKLGKNKFLEFMRECRDDQEWDVHTWLNDINGLRECLKLYKNEKSTTNDSKQKAICDSFSKRYNK